MGDLVTTANEDIWLSLAGAVGKALQGKVKSGRQNVALWGPKVASAVVHYSPAPGAGQMTLHFKKAIPDTILIYISNLYFSGRNFYR